MDLIKARTWIILVFISFLLLLLICAFYLLHQNIIYPDNFRKVIIQIFKIYSLHLSVILSTGFIFQESNSIVNKAVFYLALILSILWNLVLFFGLFQMVLINTIDIKDVLSYNKDISDCSSFLIAGILGYFFSTKKRKR